MKKFLAILLALAMAFSLAACGSSAETDSPSPDSGADTGDEIEVDEGLLNVEITIPASFFEFFSELDESFSAESLTAEDMDSRIKDFTVNEDGSLTFTVSKADHADMMAEMRQTILDSLPEMQESVSCLKGLEVNDDCTEITLSVDSAEYDEMYGVFAILSFEIQGLMYQAFNGTSDTPVVVNVVDAATGEVLDSANTEELGQ